MSAIVAFDFNGFSTVRAFTDEDGNPWWIAKDVCDILTLTNSRKTLAALDDDDKGVTIRETSGGPQEMATVNESGLYSLILRSRKPEAKAFKRWITHDVLPALRQTGRYGIEGSNVEYRLDALAERIDELAAETRRRMSDMREETASFFVRTRMNAPMPALAMPKLSPDAPTTGKGKRVLMLEIKARLAELARRGDTKIPPLYQRAVSDYTRYFGVEVIQEAQRFNKEPLEWIEKHGDVDVLHMIVHGYPLE